MKYKGTASDVGQNPKAVKIFTETVRHNTSLPILAKMTPNISDIRIPAIASKEGVADGIAAINTIRQLQKNNCI